MGYEKTEAPELGNAARSECVDDKDVGPRQQLVLATRKPATSLVLGEWVSEPRKVSLPDKFGFPGISMQTDEHFFARIKENAVFQVGENATFQSAADWTLFSKNLDMTAVEKTRIASGESIFIAAGPKDRFSAPVDGEKLRAPKFDRGSVDSLLLDHDVAKNAGLTKLQDSALNVRASVGLPKPRAPKLKGLLKDKFKSAFELMKKVRDECDKISSYTSKLDLATKGMDYVAGKTKPVDTGKLSEKNEKLIRNTVRLHEYNEGMHALMTSIHGPETKAQVDERRVAEFFEFSEEYEHQAAEKQAAAEKADDEKREEYEKEKAKTVWDHIREWDGQLQDLGAKGHELLEGGDKLGEGADKFAKDAKEETKGQKTAGAPGASNQATAQPAPASSSAPGGASSNSQAQSKPAANAADDEEEDDSETESERSARETEEDKKDQKAEDEARSKRPPEPNPTSQQSQPNASQQAAQPSAAATQAKAGGTPTAGSQGAAAAGKGNKPPGRLGKVKEYGARQWKAAKEYSAAHEDKVRMVKNIATGARVTMEGVNREHERLANDIHNSIAKFNSIPYRQKDGCVAWMNGWVKTLNEVASDLTSFANEVANIVDEVIANIVLEESEPQVFVAAKTNLHLSAGEFFEGYSKDGYQFSSDEGGLLLAMRKSIDARTDTSFEISARQHVVIASRQKAELSARSYVGVASRKEHLELLGKDISIGTVNSKETIRHGKEGKLESKKKEWDADKQVPTSTIQTFAEEVISSQVGGMARNTKNELLSEVVDSAQQKPAAAFQLRNKNQKGVAEIRATTRIDLEAEAKHGCVNIAVGAFYVMVTKDEIVIGRTEKERGSENGRAGKVTISSNGDVVLATGKSSVTLNGTGVEVVRDNSKLKTTDSSAALDGKVIKLG